MLTSTSALSSSKTTNSPHHSSINLKQKEPRPFDMIGPFEGAFALKGEKVQRIDSSEIPSWVVPQRIWCLDVIRTTGFARIGSFSHSWMSFCLLPCASVDVGDSYDTILSF